jgi:peroxiredoxin
MKRLIYFFVCLLILASCSTDKKGNTVVTGKIKGLEEGTMVYLTATNSEGVNDSVVAEKDFFRFDLTLQEGDMFLLRADKSMDNSSYLSLYLEPGKVLIEGKDTLFKDAVLSGSQFINEYNDWQNSIKSAPGLENMMVVYEEANAASRARDTAKLNSLMPSLKKIEEITNEVQTIWMREHPGSPVAAVVLSYLEYNLSLEEKETYFNNLTPYARQNAVAKKIENSIRVEKLTAVGQVAPDFTQNDTLGNPVSLKDFRGMFVLIDFWASWCGPCRAENPNIVKAFNRFKDKNFTVLGISLDRPGKEQDWLNAINKDGLTWTHVSDLKGWNNEVAVQYNIRAIPSNLLIGPDGVIIAKDLHGEELETKLEELVEIN